MPLYNEAEFAGTAISRVLNAPLPNGYSLELIVVDDGSRDGSAEVVRELAAAEPDVVCLICHPENRGKAAAIRTALEHARGEFCLIQDADLEYDPADYPALLAPLVGRRADAVFGSRFSASGERRVLYFWHSVGNRLLTLLCNAISDLNLTDIETGYKAFRTSLIRSIPLRSERFGIEPELAIKLAQRGARVYETPIRYHGRTYEEGKKIGLKDAFHALGVMLRFALTRDIYNDAGPEILDVLSAAPRFNRWMADTIRPYLGTKVLEIGAGIGNLTSELAAGKALYMATDINEEYVARLITRFGTRRNTIIEKLDLVKPNGVGKLASRFDTIVCLNVLEHVQDDLLGLSNIHSMLAPGGCAIILVPHDVNVYGTLDEVLGHYRRYSEDELRSKLEASGFKVECVLHFNRVARPGWFVNGRIMKKRTFSRFQILCYDRLVWLWRRIDRFLPWPPTSIVAVASK